MHAVSLTPLPVLPHQALTFCLPFLLPPLFSTPKMDRVHQSTTSVGVTTYLGSLEFLDCQITFDSIFGKAPTMVRVSKKAAKTCATEDTDYLANKINKYCDLCQLHLFCSIIELQFVGMKKYDTHRMIHDIYLALSGLKLNFMHGKKKISITPDTLYQRFIEFSPLLLPNTTAWSFSFVTLFTTH